MLQTQPDAADLLISLLYITASTALSGQRMKGYNIGGFAAPTSAKAQARAGWNYGLVQQAQQPQAPSFEPFPDLPELLEDGGQNIQLLLQSLDLMPSVAELSKCHTEVQLKVPDTCKVVLMVTQIMLDEINPLGYRLLHWILKTGRIQLSAVPTAHRVGSARRLPLLTLL